MFTEPSQANCLPSWMKKVSRPVRPYLESPAASFIEREIPMRNGQEARLHIDKSSG